MIWIRRIWTVLQTYWLAYFIVAGMSFLFLSLSFSNWVYVVVWAFVLVVVTSIFVLLIARDELSWDEVSQSISEDAQIPASGQIFGCVRSGQFEKHVLMIVARTSVTDLVIRIRPLDLLHWREVRVTGARTEDLVDLLNAGIVGLIDDGEVERRLAKVYFPGGRTRPDKLIKVAALREN